MTRDEDAPNRREANLRRDVDIRKFAAARAALAAADFLDGKGAHQRAFSTLAGIFESLIEGAWWAGFHQCEEEQPALPNKRLMELALAGVWGGDSSEEELREFASLAGIHLTAEYGHHELYRKAGAP